MYRLLLVDDEVGITKGLTILIQRLVQSCKVVGTAFDGEEGYQAAIALKPDIIITDIRMLQVSGLDMIRSLQQADCKAKFIILSGYAEFEYARQGMALGAQFYLNKPVEEEELRDSLLRAIRQIEEERQQAEELAYMRDSLSSLREEKRAQGGDNGADTCGKRDVITEMKAYIAEHYAENISLNELSAKFYLNPYYLSQLFKEKTGDTYMNYVMKVRIRKSRELLQTTDMKIYEVCEAVGYTDTNYFSKLFERIVGCRPSEYKKQIH